jgi:cytochrome c biogenesis protein CcmG, thiol:disulfide interchange protein DsbE
VTARRIVPLAVFVLMLGLLGAGLRSGPRDLPSPLIGQPAPPLQLASLDSAPTSSVPDALRGQVWVLNVWASWCAPCREEHPAWVAFAQSQRVPLYGLNYKDRPDDARRWLANFGNPYVQSLSDADGKAGIDWGVYGVPETFVIDRHGVVRHRHVGPITPQFMRETLLPLLQRLGA